MDTARQAARITRKQPKGEQRQAVARSRRKTRRPTQYRKHWSSDTSDATAGPVVVSDRVSELPHDLLLRAAKEKYPWIRRFVDEGCPRGKLLEYAQIYAKANGTPSESIPPYTTLREWVHRYRTHGMPGLVDSPSYAAGRSRTISGAARAHFDVAATLGMRTTRILNFLSKALPPGAALPSRWAIDRERKRFEQRNPLLVAMARKGPTWFRDNYQIALSYGLLPGGIRLSIDSTVADLWVRVRSNGVWVPMRPVLTVVEDVGARLLVTFNLSFFSIDAGICLGVLGRALNPAMNYPGLVSISAPHEIALDKGAEHLGSFRERLDALGIAVVPRQDNNPRAGAHVERLIGTITTEVFKNEIGFSQCERVFDPYAPADRDTKRSLSQLKYDPYKLEVPVEALLTPATLEAKLLGWAMVYNERPHPALAVDDPETQAVLKGVSRTVGRRHAFATTDTQPAERVA